MGFLYLILAEVDSFSQWKVGATTRDPQNRLLEMTTANPNIIGVHAQYPIDDSYLFKVEAILKRHYRSHRIKGEWFHHDSMDKEQFLNKCTQIEYNLKYLEENKI